MDNENKEHEFYMEQALLLAAKAAELDEVPIGCVIVYNGEIIGRGYNRRNTDKTPLGHAEIAAIQEACGVVGDWRLEDTTVYVTLEPCPMCAGAILSARVKTLVFGARNKKAGSCGSLLNIPQAEGYNHRVEIIEGVLIERCSGIVSDFFRDLRARNKNDI